MNSEPEDRTSFMIPGAIIIAGIFIAGAIVATNGLPAARGVAAEKETLGVELYKKLAKDLRLDKEMFVTCLEDGRHTERVQSDFDNALAAGGTGTPYNIVVSASMKKAPFDGAVPYGQLSAIVTEALADADTFGNHKSVVAETMRPLDASDHIRGNPNAPVTLVEYSDLECPFCARHHPNLLRLLEEFDGDVKWIYRHFPLTSIHSEAFPAAVAAECAGELGGEEAFWTFVDKLFSRTS